MYVLVCMCSNDRYRMNHRKRGQMIIINNKEFDDPKPGQRKGTDQDGENLKADFEKWGFTVDEFMDRKADDMIKLMEKGNNVSSSSWLS